MTDYASSGENFRSLARCRGFDFNIEDGRPVLEWHFEYGENGVVSRGLGYIVDEAFLFRFLAAVGVSRPRDLEGKACWVTRRDDRILLVEPLFQKDGKPFDVEAWIEWRKERFQRDMSIHEIATGKRP